MDLVALIKQATEQTKKVMAGVDPSNFDDPTPCSEYNVEQLADHITSFAPFSTSAATKSAMLEYVFDADSFKSTYAADVDAMADAWAQPGALEGEVTFGRGEMPADRAAAITLHELVLHGWDLAKATGQPFTVSDEAAGMVKMIAQGGVEAGARDQGTYGAEVTVGDNASPLDQALGVSGRDPNWVGS